MNAAKGIERFRVLTAIWTLSCQDENPAMSYEGISYRLGLGRDVDVWALVREYGQLFRHGLPPKRLARRKLELRDGKRVPMWLRDVDDVEERNKRIEALGADDFFRNVFRTNVSAPTTPVETLKWGIDYIDGLRKAEADSREQRLKKWSSLILPFSSLAVAAITVALGFYNQRELNRTQVQLKQYEVTARPKQEGYVRMMRAVGNAIDQSRSSNRADAARALVEWESGYYSVAPFLTNEDRGKLWNWFQKFKGRLASPATTAPSQGWSGDDPLTSLHREFGEDLFEALFMHDAL